MWWGVRKGMVRLYLERGANPPYENGVKVVGRVWAYAVCAGAGRGGGVPGGGNVEEAIPV